MKKLVGLIVFIVLLGVGGFAQRNQDRVVLRLRDNLDKNKTIEVWDDGEYELSVGKRKRVGRRTIIVTKKIFGFGKLVIGSCFLSLEDNTINYKIYVNADDCEGTGQVQVIYPQNTIELMDTRIYINIGQPTENKPLDYVKVNANSVRDCPDIQPRPMNNPGKVKRNR